MESRLFGDLFDLKAELLGCVGEGDNAWRSRVCVGTRSDGTAIEFAGVNILTVANGLVRWGRIYSEPVREVGGVDSQVARMTGGDWVTANIRRKVVGGATAT